MLTLFQKGAGVREMREMPSVFSAFSAVKKEFSVFSAVKSSNREAIVKTLWNPESRQELSQRLGRLKPEASPQWGRMSAKQMLAHVVDAMKMALGTLKIEEKKLPIRFTPLKQFLIYGPPFPKSVPTSPELLVRQCEDWDQECASFKEMLDTLGNRPVGAPLPRHPAFGKLSRREWGVLGYRHVDHHFRQFGV